MEYAQQQYDQTVNHLNAFTRDNDEVIRRLEADNSGATAVEKKIHEEYLALELAVPAARKAVAAVSAAEVAAASARGGLPGPPSNEAAMAAATAALLAATESAAKSAETAHKPLPGSECSWTREGTVDTSARD
jgi:hypothetical protein